MNKVFPIIKYHSENSPIKTQNLFKKKIRFINDEKEFSIVDNSILVIDGYTFNLDYINKFNLQNNKIIFIADVHEKVPNCEILINHLSWVTKNHYQKSNIKHFLLGSDYAILREAFFKKKTNSKGRYLICLGSTNVSKEILKIYKALKKIGVPEKNIDIVYDKKIPQIPFQLLHNLDSNEMFKIICDSEYAFITPGNISYEVISINRKIIMGSVTESQKLPLKEFQKLGLCVSVGDWSKTNFSKIENWIIESEKKIEAQKKYFLNLKTNPLKNKIKKIISL